MLVTEFLRITQNVFNDELVKILLDHHDLNRYARLSGHKYVSDYPQTKGNTKHVKLLRLDMTSCTIDLFNNF